VPQSPELFEGRILVDGEVRPCTWRTPQVRLHHGRPLLDRELFEPHVLGTTVAQDRTAAAAFTF